MTYSLLSASSVNQATRLSREEIVQVLGKSGYAANDITDAKFIGFNGTQFVYSIKYPGESGVEDGRVFVSLRPAETEKFYAEF